MAFFKDWNGISELKSVSFGKFASQFGLGPKVAVKGKLIWDRLPVLDRIN